MAPPVIITCALTGGIHGKEANPNLPEQPDEIVEQGIDAWRAGAAVLHVHARNPDGSNTMSPEIYGELHDRLALLYKDKYKDHCAAAEQYRMAAQLEHVPDYIRRFAAYELAACPGHEEEAFQQLRELYLEDEKHHLPTLLRLLGELQEKLRVPADQKVYNPT